MESTGLSLCSLMPAIGPYPKPVYSSSHLPHLFSIIHFNIILSSVTVNLRSKLGQPQLQEI
jgi:hypothetical protein